MVMAHTLVQTLACTCIEVHMAAPRSTLSVAARMVEVAETHLLDFAHGHWNLRGRLAVARELRSKSFATAYVLPNSWKSALIPFFAGIPRRVGWVGGARYGLINHRPSYPVESLPLMIERFIALAHPLTERPEQPYPTPSLTSDKDNVQRLCQELKLSVNKPVVALCPGAEFGPAKQWPAEHFAAVAQEADAQGKVVWLLGSNKDADICQKIYEEAPQSINLAGKTSLVDVIDLLSIASQVVSNDSGLMHIAAAVGVPVVGLFGSTSPDFTPPLGSFASVVQLDMSCRPCFQRSCPLGHTNCLQQLAPEQVIRTMQ